MGAHNPHQHEINAEGFVARLKIDDPDAWGTLLAYVQAQVSFIARSWPVTLERAETIDDYVSKVFHTIWDRLDQFEHRGPFSAWIDALLRHALGDTNLKNALQATERFLKASHRLSADHRSLLGAVLLRIDSPERELLQAATGTTSSPITQTRLWNRARRRLLDDPQFQQLLRTLDRAGMRQASTLLGWYAAWKGQSRLSSLQVSDSEGETYDLPLADPGPLPLDILIGWENYFDIVECLERLRQVSPQQAQALVRRALHQETDEQIAHALDHGRPATVRQWIKRGLDSLQKCVSSKLQDEQ